MSYESARLYIVDATYGCSDDIEYPERSTAFLRGLTAEFEQSFDEENIGPGADIPAFFTILPFDVWPFLGAAMYAFFKGKEIEPNIDAWKALAKRIMGFLHRKPIVDRQGASALAVAAVTEAHQQVPRTIRLISYRAVMDYDLEGHAALPQHTGIDGDTAPLSVGRVARHDFEIEVDGKRFKVQVTGIEAEIAS